MEKSFQTGKLYIVSTPIGNLEDMTYRAVRILKEVDIIAAEETRKAKILIDKFEIGNKRVISHHMQNEHYSVTGLLSELNAGKSIAVISEAGTPCISDPGFLIVREAIKNNIEPIIIPGASALTFAAAACGLPIEKLVFYGFLPPKKGARAKILEEIANDDKTAFLYESPMRIIKLLNEMFEIIGSEANIVLIREATKIHEEAIRGTITEVIEKIGDKTPKGEFVVCISSRKKKEKI